MDGVGIPKWIENLYAFGCLTTLFIFQSFAEVKQLEVGLLHREFGLTYKQCIQKCDVKVACVEVAYTRRFTLCELYITHIYPNASGVGVKHQRKTIDGTIEALCDTCARRDFCILDTEQSTVSCEPRSCMAPPLMPIAILFGSQMTIGSKVKYQCRYNASKQGLITCLGTGEWSGIECPCDAPEVDNAHAQISLSVDGHAMAVYECAPSFELHQRNVPWCNSNTNGYQEIEFVCCDKTVDPPWKTIYRYVAHTEVTIQRSWDKNSNSYFGSNNVGENCLYRDQHVFDNWETFNILKVRLDIIANDEIVAFLEFDGVGTNITTWFTQDRLLNSSWTDLNRGTPLDAFSYLGNLNNENVHKTRYLIARLKPNRKDCTGDEGWFAVTWNHYPCGYTDSYSGFRIIYSPHTQASSLEYTPGGAAFADSFEVSVLMA